MLIILKSNLAKHIKFFLIIIAICYIFANFLAYGADNLLSSPENVVDSFYNTITRYRKKSFSSELKALSVFLDKDFNALIQNAQKADTAYLKKYPTDKGILGDGTCFFYGGGDCFYTSYKITNIEMNDDNAKISVHLILTDERPGYPCFEWDNFVYLKKEKNKWLIHDIGYFETNATKVLQESIEDALSAVREQK